MKSIRNALLAAGFIAGIAAPFTAGAQDTFDRSFLPDYSTLQAKPATMGTDYITPSADVKLDAIRSVMIDAPEVLLSPDSPYKGAKPEDLLAIANLMRDSLKNALGAGGYPAVDQPGTGVLYIRLALTDLSLKKKKRGILSYTPAGAVLKAGVDATKDMMDKYDILNVAIQAELIDSASNESLVSLVAVRGDKNAKQRVTFEQLQATIQDFGSRLRCRLDNSRLPLERQIDCLDAAARQTRESASANP